MPVKSSLPLVPLLSANALKHPSMKSALRLVLVPTQIMIPTFFSSASAQIVLNLSLLRLSTLYCTILTLLQSFSALVKLFLPIPGGLGAIVGVVPVSSRRLLVGKAVVSPLLTKANCWSVVWVFLPLSIVSTQGLRHWRPPVTPSGPPPSARRCGGFGPRSS